MEKKFQYSSEQERTSIIEQNIDLYLIEEQNITEGNFLIFSDTLPEPPKIVVEVPEGEIDSLKQSIAELSYLITLGGM